LKSEKRKNKSRRIPMEKLNMSTIKEFFLDDTEIKIKPILRSSK